MEESTLRDIWDLRDKFWGDENQPAPSSGERSAKMIDLLKASFIEGSKSFAFFLKSGRKICESSFLQILGLFGRLVFELNMWGDVLHYLI